MNDLLAQLLSMEEKPDVRTQIVRGPFKYPGSKYRSIAELLPHLPYRRKFIDVCGGTGVVLTNRNPSQIEVFNDRHAGITSFFRTIRTDAGCAALIQRLEHTIHSKEEFYYCSRTWDHDTLDDLERGARWYYSVCHSFNGKCIDWDRVTNSPPAGGKIQRALSQFPRISLRFRQVQIDNLDWRMMLKDYDSPDAVFYIDPPYWGIPQPYLHTWSEQDHIECCERIAQMSGYVALSGYDLPGHPYNKFNFWSAKVRWGVRTSMNGKVGEDKDSCERVTAEECLWIKE